MDLNTAETICICCCTIVIVCLSLSMLIMTISYIIEVIKKKELWNLEKS